MLKERPFDFYGDKSIRVITDTDCACECDDQYAVAHFLMTSRFDMRGIIAEHFATENSEQQSYDEIVKITEMMGLKGEVNILHGAPTALVDEHTPIESEGARFIIEEAMKDDPRPLFVCNQGAITNLASAYLIEPKIAEKITVIWIGGKPYLNGKGGEFNLDNDVNAARVIFKSNLNLWQIPSNVYSTMRITFMELLTKVYPYGEIGRYLVENTINSSVTVTKSVFGKIEKMMKIKLNSNEHLSPQERQGLAVAATSFGGEIWSLGDSPCVGLLLNSNLGNWHMQSAPCDLTEDGSYDLSRPGSREIRVYDDINSRIIIEDMCAKLQYYFGE